MPPPKSKLSPLAITEVQSLLQQSPELTPAGLLELARTATGPLHDAFEWRDDVAAQRFRLQQAQNLIIRVKVRVKETAQQTVRAKVSILSPGQYRPPRALPSVTSANSNSPVVGARSKDVHAAIAELEALRRKYNAMPELAGIWVALEELKDPKKGVLRRAVEAAREHELKGYTRPEAAALAAQTYKLPVSAVLEEVRATA